MKTENVEVCATFEAPGPDGKPIKHRKVVAVIQVNQFDTIDEAVANLGGDKAVLKLVNSQYKTDLMNRTRGRVTNGLSMTAAINMVREQLMDDSKLMDELRAIRDAARARAATPEQASILAQEASTEFVNKLAAELVNKQRAELMRLSDSTSANED